MRNKLLLLAAALMTLVPTSACVAHRVVVVGRPNYGGSYRPYGGPAGEVRLETRVPDAGVFVNGAYAGTTRQNRSMRMRPGSYTIEIRQAGRTRYAENIHVVVGRTLHLQPEL